MSPDSATVPDALSLLARCDLFSDFHPAELPASEREALAPHASIVRLKRGEILMLQDEPPDCMYAVVSGRFDVVVDGPDHERNLVGELHAGEAVGELGLIDGNPRMATVIASRDSLLVRVTAEGFDRLVRSRADSLIRIARAEAARMRSMGQRRSPGVTVRTIAVLGDTGSADFRRFTAGLCDALRGLGSVLYVNLAQFEAAFSGNADAASTTAWLSELENANRFVVCEAAAEVSPWTMHALGQADRVLLVHTTSGRPDLLLPDLLPVERVIIDEHKAGRMPATELVLLHATELVLLHASSGPVFQNTAAWLAPRTVLRHHHVRAGDAADAGRVARLLAGEAMGLVLGGGGARGFAHIGVLQALEEAGISVDMVCGVSTGAIVAGLHAMGLRAEEIHRLIKREMRRRLASFTLPIVSLASGARFRRAMKALFGDAAIEDLGLGYFCTSCDLSTGELVVHRTGSLLHAVLASNAIPVVLPPVLSGGHMLIDGGILNNQPGDVLKKFCGGPVIVTNVSPRREATVDAAFSEMPSPWRILRSRLNPFERSIYVPGIAATMMRAVMVASERKSREVELMADFYLRPPVDRFRMDDFARIDEIVQAGYEYARGEVRSWQANVSLAGLQSR